MIEIGYKPQFFRQFKKLPSALQEEVHEKIALFRHDPHNSTLKTHKLKGRLRGRWRFSVNYSYRIIFRFEGKRTAVFLAVGDHDVYR